MDFIATPDNPVPGDPTLVSVTTRDGIPLRAAYWMPETEAPQGTVCILQGRAEFIEKYFETVGELLDRGFAVVAFDWRGQGLSGRQVSNPRKGHVRRFSDYRHDLEAIRDQILVPHMPEPHFGLAHSMGGAIALNAAYETWLPFRRLVTTTPMIALCIIKRTRAVRLAGADPAAFSAWASMFVPGGGETSISTLPFKGNRLTERSCALRPQRRSRPCHRRRRHRRADGRLARRRLPLHEALRRSALCHQDPPADAHRGGRRRSGLRHAGDRALRRPPEGRLA